MAVIIRLGRIASKTQWLQCFQMDQAPRMMMEFNPFRTCPSTLPLALAHHSSKDRSSICGVRICRRTFCKMPNQTCHETSRWSIVSSKTQEYEFSNDWCFSRNRPSKLFYYRATRCNFVLHLLLQKTACHCWLFLFNFRTPKPRNTWCKILKSKL